VSWIVIRIVSETGETVGDLAKNALPPDSLYLLSLVHGHENSGIRFRRGKPRSLMSDTCVL
jgi:hypothetical protein